MHYCCVYGFMGYGLIILVCHLIFTFAAGTDPHSFFNNFHKYDANSSGLLQIVPGLKGPKQNLVDKQANRTANVYIYNS